MNTTYRSHMSVDLIQMQASDDMVAKAARVSTLGSNDSKATQGFIDFLWKNNHGCYDSQTEVLTRDGWKFWPEVSESDEFLTTDLDGKKAWQRPLRVIHKDWCGNMIRVKTGMVDLLVTPDHRMMIKRRTNGGWKPWHMDSAERLTKSSVRLPLGLSGEWVPETTVDPTLASLFGFIIGDGCVQKTSVQFNLRKKRKIDWLRPRVESLGMSLSKLSSGGFGLVGSSREFKDAAAETYTEDRNRCIPEWLLNAQENALEGLFEGLIESDGYKGDEGRLSFCTSSPRLRDQMQELCAKLGKSASWYTVSREQQSRGTFATEKDAYIMTIRSDRCAETRVGWTVDDRARQVSTVDYEGSVHCATVPSGVLYVRRNGKPMWCGNSPFEHNLFTFLVECPIFVSRELVRHRIASYNETSGRYRELEGVFYIPPKNRKLQQVGKTGDYNFVDGTPDQFAAVEVEYTNACEQAWHSYRTMLDAGVAKEVARGVLPTTLYTSLYVTMNARGLINFLNLRLDHHAQAEIREVAEKMAWYLQASCPMTYAAWQKYK